VIVAEGDAAEREMLAFQLSQAGFHVRVCGAGLAVLVSAGSDTAAVVLAEHLRGMSGLEVCQRLRANPATCDVPIVMLGSPGADAEGEALAAFDAGADDWLQEPLHAREFVIRLRALLTRCRRHPGRYHRPISTGSGAT